MEVFHELKAHYFGTSEGNGGIAGKITIDLDGKEKGSQQEAAAIVVGRVIVDGIHINGEAICHYHFHEEPP